MGRSADAHEARELHRELSGYYDHYEEPRHYLPSKHARRLAALSASRTNSLNPLVGAPAGKLCVWLDHEGAFKAGKPGIWFDSYGAQLIQDFVRAVSHHVSGMRKDEVDEVRALAHQLGIPLQEIDDYDPAATRARAIEDVAISATSAVLKGALSVKRWLSE